MTVELGDLLKIYSDVKKGKRDGYVSPAEIIIWAIENKGDILIELNIEDFKVLRGVPMIPIGREEERYKLYDIEKHKRWLMAYIRRKRPDLFTRISITKEGNSVIITGKD